MTIYWTMSSVPELNGLDKPAKVKLFKEMYKEGRRKMGMKQFLLRFMASLIIVAIGIKLFPESLFANGGFIGLFIIGGIVGGLVGLIFVILVQSPIIDNGREWLREQGYPK